MFQEKRQLDFDRRIYRFFERVVQTGSGYFDWPSKKYSSSANSVDQVEADGDEAMINALLQSTGIIGRDWIAAHVRQTERGTLSLQRVLYCQTYTGRSAMVRQINPTLHFESKRHHLSSFHFQAQLKLSKHFRIEA